ncbi:putative kinase-like protein D1044.1 [Oratosquilla oratoria]|uniref:putative kinase-like protein D1044.1 n=1 Tax=Oratosquilla oratoria TaxID=337810 RepID=UPI003F758CB5
MSPPSMDGHEALGEKVLTKDLVTACLEADKGKDVVLKSFEVKNFTAIGDGLTSHVTGVLVDYQSAGRDHQVSYVAKINKPSNHTDTVLLMREFFEKEQRFYTEIVPVLNEELRRAGLRSLNIPRCLFVQSKKGEEVIFLEDLRERGFKKLDCRQGLDEAHCNLVVEELARFHAASVLLQEKSKVDLLESYPYLFDCFEKEDFPYESYRHIFGGAIGAIGEATQNMEGYEKAAHYIKEVMKPQFYSLYREGIRSTSIKALVQTDCGANNFLFRYNEDGVPEEVAIIDFQFVRRSSPTVDILCVLCTSTEGDFRHTHRSKILRTYYEVFKGVLQAGGLEPDFTVDDLEKDYESRRVFGFLLGVLYSAVVLRQDGKGARMGELDEENVDAVIQKNQEEIGSTLDDPVIKDRIVSILDDIVSSGIV